MTEIEMTPRGARKGQGGRGRGPRRKYDALQLLRAIVAVVLDMFEIRKAQRKWKVDRTTLNRYVKRFTPEDKEALRAKRERADAGLEDLNPEDIAPLKMCIMGRPAILTKGQEEQVEQYAKKMMERNLPLTRRILVHYANRVLRFRTGGHYLSGIPVVTESWVRSFLKRHPDLTLRTTEPLSKERFRQTTVEALEPHLKIYKAVLTKYGLIDEPRRTWNVDETSMRLGTIAGRVKVIVMRGVRRVFCRKSGDSRHVSLVFAVNAAGDISPSTFILPTATVPKPFWDAIDALGEDEWAAVTEKKGFITERSFYGWLKLFVQFLDEHVRAGKLDEEHLLVMDQASAHCSLRIMEYAEDHHVLLYALPSHTTHLTQPVDVGLFGPLKAYYRDAQDRLLRKRDYENERAKRNWKSVENGSSPPGICDDVDINDIPALTHYAIRHAFTKENVASAFRATSICPFESNALLSRIPAIKSKHDDDQDADDDDNDQEGDVGDVEEPEELMTAAEQRAADTLCRLREPTARRPFPKAVEVGLMRSKDYKAAEEAAAREKKAKATQKMERKQKKLQQKRAREEEVAQRRAGREAKQAASTAKDAAGQKPPRRNVPAKLKKSRTLTRSSVRRLAVKGGCDVRLTARRIIRPPQRYMD